MHGHIVTHNALAQDLLESSGMGGLNDIHPIQNLSRESTVSMEASILLCTALRAALFAAVDYLEDDPDSMDLDPPATHTPSKVSTLRISVEQQMIWAA